MDEQLEELFGKHFNGLHWEDITKEMMMQFAKGYAKLKVDEEKQTTRDWLISDNRIHQVIDCLDGFGRQTHSVEYGLPVENKGEEMHSMVKAILNNR